MKEIFNMRRDRKNRSRAQITTIVLCLLLAMAITIGGTVAWLVDKTEPVKDTFTYGNINIELVEGNTNNNTKWANSVHNTAYTEALYSTTDEKGNFKLIPGAPIDFNPYVWIDKASEDCYVFVKIEDLHNTLTDSEKVVEYTIVNEWTPLADNVYYQKLNVSTLASDKYLQIITDNRIVINPNMTKNFVDAASTTPSVTITAYAIQSAYLTDQNNNGTVDATDAWALLNDQLPSSNP